MVGVMSCLPRPFDYIYILFFVSTLQYTFSKYTKNRITKELFANKVDFKLAKINFFFFI